MVAYFIGFIALVILFLALDLGVFHRDDRIMSTRAALLWTAFWIFIALLFNGLIYILYEYQLLGASDNIKYLNGKDASIAFFTAYVVEKSLSIDNIFVIAMIFGYFKVPLKYQHRVLFWGIISALIMRGILIWLGIEAFERWSYVSYIFGIVLILTALRMIFTRDKPKPEKNIILRLTAKLFPISKEFSGGSFFIKTKGRITGTPLLLVLISIESMDLLFAIDSIPAVLAFTLDPFIVFTSNVFAILGLRSLYFALVSLLEHFRYLKHSLIFILLFVGIKMILSNHLSIDPLTSLGVVLGILCIGIIASLLFKRRSPRK
jgi:tellurite resistance protein TerC